MPVLLEEDVRLNEGIRYMVTKTFSCPNCGAEKVVEVELNGLFMLACGLTVRDRCSKCGKRVVFKLKQDKET